MRASHGCNSKASDHCSKGTTSRHASKADLLEEEAPDRASGPEGDLPGRTSRSRQPSGWPRSFAEKIGCLELLDHYLDRVARHSPT